MLSAFFNRKKSKSKATAMATKLPDPLTDPRYPSEIHEIFGDCLDPIGKYDPLHMQKQKPIFSEAYAKAENIIDHVKWKNPGHYVMLMYAMAQNGYIDIYAIADDDYDFQIPPVDRRGFKGIAMNTSGSSKLTRYTVEEMTEEMCEYNDVTENGPFFVPLVGEGKYKLIDMSLIQPLMTIFLRNTRSHAMFILDFDIIFTFSLPPDLPEEYIGDPVRRRTMSFSEYESRGLMLRIMDEMLAGNIRDFAAIKMFRSEIFREWFFQFVRKKEKINELFRTVEKDSNPNQGKGFMYYSVANPFPNNELFKVLMKEIDSTKLKKEEKQFQFNKAFAAACRWGHYEVFRMLWDQEPSLPFECLRSSILGANPSITEIIIRNGDWTSEQLDKAMEWACFVGEQETFNYLKQAGANCTERCFYEVAHGGNFHMFLELCREGFDMEATFRDNRTLLHAAAEQGNHSILEFLLKRGLDVNAETSSGLIPLQLAIKNGHSGVAEFLLSCGSKINMKDTDGMTPLLIACTQAETDLMKQLIQSGADINAVDNRGQSLLHKAAINGDTRLIQELPDSLNIEAVDKEGNTVVHLAIILGHDKAVEKFIDKKPELISVANKSNWNPLVCAAYVGHDTIFDFLLGNGADPLEITKDKKTVQQMAAEGKKLKLKKGVVFSEMFGVEVVFGEVANFDKIIKKLKILLD